MTNKMMKFENSDIAVEKINGVWMFELYAVGNNGSLYCVSKTGNANSAGYKQFIYDQCRQKRFLGKYSYFTVSSKSFDKSKLSESEIDKLGNQLSSFCERCAKGGVFYGFNYRKKRIH